LLPDFAQVYSTVWKKRFQNKFGKFSANFQANFGQFSKFRNFGQFWIFIFIKFGQIAKIFDQIKIEKGQN
jgi:hypothetical protein